MIADSACPIGLPPQAAGRRAPTPGGRARSAHPEKKIAAAGSQNQSPWQKSGPYMLRPDFQNTDIELGRSGSASLVNNYALVWAPRLRMCRGFSTRDCREGHLVRAHA